MPTSKTNAKMASDDKMGMKCPCCCGPGYIVVKILALIILPFLLLWSLNALFFAAAPIAYTTYTWLAALIIIVVLSGKAFKRLHFMGGCGCGGRCCSSC